MNILKKIWNLLRMHVDSLKLLAYILTTSKTERRARSRSEYIWTISLAASCGACPITYPLPYPTPTHFIAKILTFSYLFRFLSYRDINRKLKKNNSIFVKTDELGYFRDKILPKIGAPFVLVTAASDWSTKGFADIADNKYLLHWFSQHNNVKHKKISVLPAGIDFGTLIFREYFGEKKMSAAKQESRLKKVAGSTPEKQFEVFANFHLNYTSPRRKQLHELMRDESFMHFQKTKMPRTKMWELQKKFVFNFSPAGNGLDAYRTWESLLLGQIPIVERMHTDIDDLHKEYPVVIIDDVSEINEKNLRKWHKKYSKMFGKDLEKKLTNDYWVGLIREAQGQFLL